MSGLKLVVAFGERAKETYWTPEARAILAPVCDPVEVDLAVDGEAALDAALRDADALLLCGWYGAGVSYLSRERLAAAPRLRFIGTAASDRHAQFLDLDAVAERGIAVADTSRTMAPWVAEYELALTLGALRRIPQEHTIVGEGGWRNFRDAPVEFDRLEGRRVGLLSFGAIHRHFAKLIAPFGTDWEALDPWVAPEAIREAGGRPATDLRALAERSEILCVATPPNADTLGLVSREAIEALAPGSLLVVVSRMIVVDQAALLERLARGDLRLATDVYEPEPPAADDPLRHHPDVVHTPHRAGGTLAAHRAVFDELCRETVRFSSGDPLRHPLRPELVRLVPRDLPLPD